MVARVRGFFLKHSTWFFLIKKYTLHNIYISKNFMKKRLFWILTTLFWIFSFCSAEIINWNSESLSLWDTFWWTIYFLFPDWYNCLKFDSDVSSSIRIYINDDLVSDLNNSDIYCNINRYYSAWTNSFNVVYYNLSLWWWTPSSSNIDVYYNNWQSSTNIECDWTQAIEINWLSTLTSTNTFTPYFNIDYTDQDNQKLTESYSKNTLYLSGWLFKKTYTWDNERVLTDTIESSNSDFTWYVPIFDVTWTINENTWNIFNNFSDNALTFLLSNIPAYIQWVILIAVLWLIFWIVRRFKR